MWNALDPPDVVTLHRLLDTRNLTSTAKELGITQSSMSHRLRKLREALGDELLVRKGRALVPTPRALAMKEPLAEGLRRIEQALSREKIFEPESSVLAAELVVPDIVAPLLPRVVATLSRRAPKLALRLVPLGSDLRERVATECPTLLLAPAHLVPENLSVRVVGRFEFSVLGRKNHPAFRKPLSVEEWLRFQHVTVSPGTEGTNPLDEALEKRGLRRSIGITVPSFLTGLHTLPDSNFLMNAPWELVRPVATRLRLERRALPLQVPKVALRLAWHERFGDDPGHAWLRETLQEILGKLLAATPTRA